MSNLFDGGNQTVVVRDQVFSRFHVRGQLLSPAPLGENSVVGFERQANGVFGDFFSVPGTGESTSPGDSTFDRFRITEPVPPNDADTSPGANYQFDGGTVVYTGTTSETTAQDGDPTVGDPTWFASYSFSEIEQIELPAVGGVAVRRVKLAENNSPIPRNRLYLDYRFFNDVAGSLGDVNRYSFGIEKLLGNGLTSVDLRIPFAATLDSNQVEGGALARDVEFGNISIAFKDVYYNGRKMLISWGAGIGIPTADDTRLYRSNGREIMVLENQAIHFTPYGAFLYAPDQLSWLQGFTQLDIDLNGNTILGDASGTAIERIGKLQDSTWLMMDVSCGRWVYESSGQGAIERAAVLGELHYNTTLNDADVVTGNGITVTDFSNRLDVLSATGGMHFLMEGNYTLTTGVTVPLRDDDDKQFDYEAVVLVNYQF